MKQLKTLTAFPAVSGNEDALANWLKLSLRPIAKKVLIDKVGNVLATRGKPKITLVAHMDKVGYMISQINGKKILAVQLKKAKAIPPKGKKWSVIILGKVAVEAKLTSTNSGLKVEVDDKKSPLIKVGDLVTLSPNFSVKNKQIISQGLDNCLGILAALKTFEKAKNICLIFTVQEEIGQLGARVATGSINSDAIIVLDTTYDEGNIKMGKGPALCLKDDIIFDKRLVNKLIETAKFKKIPYQLEVLESGGSDARAVREIDGTIPVVLVGIPIKNMHSPEEVSDLSDVIMTIKLLIKFIGKYV